MLTKRVKKSVGRGLRRTLWELLTPSATSYSQALNSFAHLDTGTFTAAARQYHSELVDFATVCCTYAWHQTMNGNAIYQTGLPRGLNRAETFLALQLLEFGHVVAKNVLDQIRSEKHEPGLNGEPPNPPSRKRRRNARDHSKPEKTMVP